MKKFILSLTVILFMLFNVNLNAQVATNYTWTQSTETYTPITGGTVVATATNNTFSGSLYNQVYTVSNGTIPFTFIFDGVGYTGCYISTNGYITFGSAPASDESFPLSTSSSGYRVISAFGAQNNSLFNVGGYTGQIRYETVGSEFIIQYSNFRPFNTSTTVYWRWNFQIRLNSNGQIKIVYDANYVGSPANKTCQIGLRGTNNNFSTNVNNRKITNGVNTWATSIPGTASNSNCAIITTNIPVSGQTYIWTPLSTSPDEVGVTSISNGLSPLALFEAGTSVNIISTVKNFGTAVQNAVPVYYNVNDGPAIGPINTIGPIIQNNTEDVTFSGANAFTPLTPGTYTIKSWTALGSDPDPSNDTASVEYTVVSAESIPYVENWNNLTQGWSVVLENSVGPNPIWGTGIARSPAGVYDTMAVANFYTSFANRRELFRSPLINLAGATNPVLNFYVAYKTYSTPRNDTIEVLVSTDNGVTFFSPATVYNKNYSQTPSLATRPPNGSAFYPDSAVQWRHETVSLANVAGMNNIVIGFRAKSQNGNLFWLDDIIVSDVSELCSDEVTSPGSFNCNPLLTIDFSTVGRPAPLSGLSNVTGFKTETENTFGKIETLTGQDLKFVNNNITDNASGGTLFVSQFTNNDPGQTISPNVGFTDATPPIGPAYDPVIVYHDYWFTVTYTGNDYSGYATYDVKFDLDGLVFTDPSTLYIVKRVDKTSAWVCQNTTMSGHALMVSGLTDFCDFAIAGSDTPLPVELTSFVSTINGRNVELNWVTSSESNNSGFDLERKSLSGSWSKIANISGNGNSSISHSYSYIDRNLVSGNYSYRLKQFDYNGNFEYFNLSNEIVIGIPDKFSLSQNYPNPFNPSTKINFEIPFDSKVNLKLFDMTGKEVRTIVNDVKTAGYYTIELNASDLTSGVYYYTLTANGYKETKKLMLLK